MFTLPVKIRQWRGKKNNRLRKNDILPAILYGKRLISIPLEVDLKFFEKIYKQAEESSLINLKIENIEDIKKFLSRNKSITSCFSNAGRVGKEHLVLIHDIQRDPITEKFIHVDFYQPRLEEKTEAKIILVFEGEAPAVKELGGTLVKNIHELTVKALPQDLPKEIKVNVSYLKTFEDVILVKDLEINEKIEILKDPKEVVASVSPPAKVEEELEKPVEEKVEEVEKVEKKKEEPVSAEATTGKEEEKNK